SEVSMPALSPDGGAGARRAPGLPPGYWTTKVTFMSTRHSVIVPSSEVTTLTSLTHAPLMPLTDSAALRSPTCTASSMLLDDDALSSITFATAMTLSFHRSGRGCDR